MPKWRRISRNLLWRLVRFLTAILYVWNIAFMAKCVSAQITVEYRILDNITEGTAIGNMETDAELSQKYTRDELSIMSFIFLPSTLHHQYWHYFKLSPETGGLSSATNVDRDEICPQMSQCDVHLSVAIQPAKYFQLIRVRIVFDDYNDNPPSFTKKLIKLSVAETVSPGLLLQVPPAVDPDSPENGIKGYTLICDKELFQLVVLANSSTSSSSTNSVDNKMEYLPTDTNSELKVMLLQSLDREYKAEHELVLIAYDDGQPEALKGNMTITVKVDDVNDNSPKFLNPSLTAKVLENSIKGSLVIYMSAFDPDEGANGKIVYRFSNETIRKYGDQFKIKSSGGKITLKTRLDYEQKAQYSLDVIAQDLGSHSFPATAKVIVEVVDLNDNSPDIVVQPQYEENKLVVVENSKPGASIAFISATDKDSSQNGIVSCRMDQKSYEVFELIQVFDGEYKLVTRVKLDREQKAGYDVTISCKDMGNPPQETDVTLEVIVLDENDHIPTFERDIYECALLENTPTQTNLLQVKANEPDSGINGIITYKLDKDAGRAFVINETTGVIDVVTAFNRETVGDLIEFRVLAIDTAIVPQTSTATVKVSILDVDDNGPKFVKPKYIFHIYENTEGETALGHVTADDSDEFPYNRFSYYLSLDSKSDVSAFHVDPKSGQVWAKKAFDREKHQWHFVTIIAQSDDKPNHQDQTLVQIYIKDKNDNAPNVTFPSINNDKVYISSLITAGTEVAQVKAFDSDEGLNSKLRYYFPSVKINKYPFSILEETGQVFVSGNVSNFVHKVFVVELVVRDRGQEPLSAKTVINMIVTNKISQQNTWDRERMARDRGMSMAVRIAILSMVVVMAVVSIFGGSMLIRLWVVRKKKKNPLGSSSLPSLHMNSNGYIPGSMQYGTDSGEEEFETEEERWIVQSHKTPNGINAESYEDLTQPFDTMKTYKSEDSYENKSSHPSSSISPSTSYSTETQQSGIIRKQRRRSLPQAPSTETCKVINNWKTSYGSMNRKLLPKGPDRYNNSSSSIRRKEAGDLYRNFSMDSNGVIYKNRQVKQPDLQRAVGEGHPKYQAFPDLVLHQYKKKIVQFTEGSKKLSAKPYEDPWNKIHLNRDRLKHSIPGHCTIIDRSETSNDESISNSSGNHTGKQPFVPTVQRDRGKFGSVNKADVVYRPKERYKVCIENQWQTRNNKDLSKPVIRVEAPTPTPNCDMEGMQRQLVKVPPATNQAYAEAIERQLKRSCSLSEDKFIPSGRQPRMHYKSDLNIANNIPVSRDRIIKPVRVHVNGYHHGSQNFAKTLPHLDKGRNPTSVPMNGLESSMYRNLGRNQGCMTRALRGYNPKIAASSKQKQYLSMIELDAVDSDSSYI